MATSEIKQRFRPTEKAKPGKVVKRIPTPPPSHVGQFTTSFMCAVSKYVWALAIQAWPSNAHICYTNSTCVSYTPDNIGVTAFHRLQKYLLRGH